MEGSTEDDEQSWEIPAELEGRPDMEGRPWETLMDEQKNHGGCENLGVYSLVIFNIAIETHHFSW